MTEDRAALAAAVDRVGDRWTLLVLHALLDGPLRYGDLSAQVAGIASNVLSQRLKHLEREGLLLATPYQHRPTRYRYELSPSGRALADVLRLLTQWGAEYTGVGEPLRHDACGTTVEARWWCPTCARVVDLDVTDLHHL